MFQRNFYSNFHNQETNFSPKKSTIDSNFFKQNFSSSSTQSFNVEIRNPRFDFHDFGGNKSILESLSDIVRYLQKPKSFKEQGIDPPKSAIFYGPPGTGKTLLAEALAGHAGVRFVLVSGSELVAEFIGQGERWLRELFNKVRSDGPLVLCLDEIDSIGGKRFTAIRTGGELHANTTINQLLTLLSQDNKGSVIIGTTNNYESLDPALIREGRFDRHIKLPLPDLEDREHILAVHSRNKKLSPQVSLRDLATLSPGFSSAKLERWINEAALAAVRQNAASITMTHFDEARDMLNMGVVMHKAHANLDQARRVAIHEAGHALVGHLVGKTVYQISISANNNGNGYTEFLTDIEDNPTKQQMLDTICSNLAGRAAEEVMGVLQLGSKEDFEKAKLCAIELIKNGLGSTLSGISPEIEIETILHEQMNRAIKMLKENNEKFEIVINALIKNQVLNKEEFLNVLEKKPIQQKSPFWQKKNSIPLSKKPLDLSDIASAFNLTPMDIMCISRENKDYVIQFTSHIKLDRVMNIYSELDSWAMHVDKHRKIIIFEKYLPEFFNYVREKNSELKKNQPRARL